MDARQGTPVNAPTDRWIARWDRVSRPHRAIVLTVGYLVAWVLLHHAAGWFAVDPGISAWYLPTGLVFGYVLVFGARALPVIAFGLLLTLTPLEWRGGGADSLLDSLRHAVIFGGGALLLRHVLRTPRPFHRMRDIVRFTAVSVPTALVSAVLGTAVDAHRLELSGWTAGFDRFSAYFIGEAAGLVVLAPLLISLLAPLARGWVRARGLWALPAARTLLVYLAGSVAYLWAAFVLLPALGVDERLWFLAMVPMVAAALHGGYGGVVPFLPSLNVLLILMLPSRPADPPLQLEALVLTIGLLGLLVGGVVSERRAVTDRLRGRERRLQKRVEDQVQALQAEVRERNQALAALGRTTRRLATAERIGHLGHWEWDVGKGRGYWSDEHFRIFGEAPGSFEPTEAAFRERIHPEDRVLVADAERDALAGLRPYEVHFRARRPDGSLRHCRSQAEVRHDPTGPVMIGTVLDITDLKETEIELRKAKERAELANRAKSNFLAVMSHELRTPMNAILGFSEIIRDEGLGPVGAPLYAEYAGDIYESARHLLTLINDILDISKIEAGKRELAPGWLDLKHMVCGVERLLAAEARRKELTVDIAVPTPPPSLLADERAVRQILFNLLSNAIKFTPVGGRIEIRVGVALDGMVELRVSDTGIGIPASQLDRVMEPFEQIDSPYNRSVAGSGLGLSLVRALTGLHRGRVAIDSEVDRGTTVTVGFPPHHDALERAAATVSGLAVAAK